MNLDNYDPYSIIESPSPETKEEKKARRSERRKELKRRASLAKKQENTKMNSMPSTPTRGITTSAASTPATPAMAAISIESQYLATFSEQRNRTQGFRERILQSKLAAQQDKALAVDAAKIEKIAIADQTQKMLDSELESYEKEEAKSAKKLEQDIDRHRLYWQGLADDEDPQGPPSIVRSLNTPFRKHERDTALSPVLEEDSKIEASSKRARISTECKIVVISKSSEPSLFQFQTEGSIRKIAVSATHVYGIDENGMLYAQSLTVKKPSSALTQICNRLVGDEAAVAGESVPDTAQRVIIDAGAGQPVSVVASHGNVFACMSTGQAYQLISDDGESIITPVRFASQLDNITAIQSGGNFCIVEVATKELYFVGLGDCVTEPTPLVVKRGRRVVQVACGSQHLLARTEYNNQIDVFSMGVGENLSEMTCLGRGGTRLDFLHPIAALAASKNSTTYIAASNFHSMALTGDGTTIVFGRAFGKDSKKPITCWDNFSFQEVYTGDDFAIGCEESNSLYKLVDLDKKPVKINFDPLFGSSYKIRDVAFGTDRAFVLVEVESHSKT
eukprot:scaffold1340_cov233-Amphora_coffeaeformis.AAC.4